MEKITIEEIGKWLALIVAIIGGIKYLLNEVKILNEKSLEPVNKKIDNLNTTLNSKIDNFELSHMKGSLVNYMCMAESFELTEEQKKNAHELYDKYTSLGHNSYVHDKFEKLVEENKI